MIIQSASAHNPARLPTVHTNVVFRLGALLLALVLPAVAHAQLTGKPIQAPAGFLPSMAIYCDDGTGHAQICASATGGTGGDASAANQTTQITAATLTNTRIGDVSNPASGTMLQRLATINSTLGMPFQAGGLIGNTTFGATQSGIWDLRNITGTIPLPTGAATAAAQATGNTALSTIASNSALGRDSGGRLLPGQGVVATTRTTLSASTAASIAGAASGRVGLTVQVEAALTSNLFLCTTQGTGCSATSYDAMIPSGSAAGSTYTFLFAPSSTLYAFSTSAPTLVTNSWSAQ